ncbi:MAG: hypothetical protein JJU20_04330 [Opitutales bacterium]|nr:hypothetical protein [Opitutales bacterium]
MNRIYWPSLKVLLLLALISIAYFVLIAFYPAVDWARDRVIAAKWWAVSIAAGWLLTQMFWYFSGRSRSLFHWVFVGLLCSGWVIVLGLAREGQYEFEKAYVERINETRQQMRARAAREAAEALRELRERERQLETDRFAQYEGRVDREGLLQVRELDARMQEKLRQQMDAYRRVVAEYPLRGPDTWLRFQTVDRLEEERTAYQRHSERNRSLVEFLQNFRADYEAEIDALELPSSLRRVALAELQRILIYWEVTHTREVRELDQALFTQALQAIDILRNHWGEWRWNPRESQILFDSERVERAFWERVSSMQMILRELDELTGDSERESEEPDWVLPD